MSQESAMQEEIEDLRADLEAAKQLEAEQANALKIARGSLETCAGIFKSLRPFVDEQNVLTANPSAALAERDRAIEKRVAERCADIANTYYPAGWVKARIDREFNLEPKPEGA